MQHTLELGCGERYERTSERLARLDAHHGLAEGFLKPGVADLLDVRVVLSDRPWHKLPCRGKPASESAHFLSQADLNLI